MEYSGINLPENVIIVENKYGQGYVVSEGSSLDNARNWAERSDWEPKEYKYKRCLMTKVISKRNYFCSFYQKYLAKLYVN